MQELKDLNLNELDKKIISRPFHLVSVDYDRESGIKMPNKKVDTLNIEELKNAYKIYIFNDDFMITVYNFGANKYKYSEIKKEDIEKEREKYIYMKENNKLRLRIGKLKNSDREVFQYISIDKEGK